MSSQQDTGRSYHLKCTGDALSTAQAHGSPNGITLFGSCFCPFVQRVWVTLEHLGIDYMYYEVDPYKKPEELLELSPKGLVPAIRLNYVDPPRSLNESTVIMDFLEDYTLHGVVWSRFAASNTKRSSHTTGSLFPPLSDPYKQIEGAKGFNEAIEGLVTLFTRAEREGYTAYGLWHERGSLSYADVMAAPWLFRATNVLKHYRGFVLPQGARFRAYVDRVVNHPAFKRTCSTEQLYAFNRPNTSQVANAINAGTALP
ncbi:hypothetical protein ONZ51_g10640 [Trametes cubensis]|uniref:GST N-terminal domain-containing protein n=1 Tax=Trametes cubensis TaxID=1111947 RepID=A0AAD7TLP9_9APHY|nr:hypothetical protein ONZ51_g10640 [Trametes cubensis]